jgi:predicted AlkP superfamily pyrophosphatase or phosphodiesterase
MSFRFPRTFGLLATLFTLSSLSCVVVASAANASPAPVILISLDGFRWDYCEKYPEASPTLRKLRREGVTSRGLIPVFPSNTFPNHYSIVTGLYPANHGVVNNDFLDPATGLIFRYNNPSAVRDPRWWGGEPIWVTAIKHGQKAATAFWVGSEAPVQGIRPTYWRHYDYSIPFEKRLDELVGWLTGPVADRPSVISFYLEETNSAGHAHGPDAPEVAAAVKLCDERVAALSERLRSVGIAPNLVIVSDHGMVATAAERVVILDDYLDLGKVHVDTDGSSAALRPLDGDVEALFRAVEKLPHAKAYRVADLPRHLRFGGNPRIAPVWVLSEEGWHVGTRASFDRLRRRYPSRGYLGGDHGYDPTVRTMHGIFIAHGPGFRRGVELEAFENVHIYNLLCALLNLPPAPNDGDDRLVGAALAR